MLRFPAQQAGIIYASYHLEPPHRSWRRSGFAGTGPAAATLADGQEFAVEAMDARLAEITPPGPNGLLYLPEEDALLVCDQPSRSIIKYDLVKSSDPVSVALAHTGHRDWLLTSFPARRLWPVPPPGHLFRLLSWVAEWGAGWRRFNFVESNLAPMRCWPVRTALKAGG